MVDQIKAYEEKSREQQGKINILDAKVQELETRNASLIEDLDAEKVAHERDLKAGIEMNDELQRQLAAKTASKKSGLPVVDVDGEMYRTRYPKILLEDGRTLTAEEVVADLGLCRKLIEEKSGMLRKV